MLWTWLSNYCTARTLILTHIHIVADVMYVIAPVLHSHHTVSTLSIFAMAATHLCLHDKNEHLDFYALFSRAVIQLEVKRVIC